MCSLKYSTQVLLPLVGSKTAAGTRTPIALTTSYQAESGNTVPTKTFDVGGFSRVEFAILYTMGSGETSNSIEMIAEWSPDATNFYRLANDTTVTNTSTMTKREFTHVGENATTSAITWGLDIAYKDVIRISFKETGVETNAGSVFCEALLSG